MLTPEQLADIRGNIRIYDNRVAERDVGALLKEVERLTALLAERDATLADLRSLLAARDVVIDKLVLPSAAPVEAPCEICGGDHWELHCPDRVERGVADTFQDTGLDSADDVE